MSNTSSRRPVRVDGGALQPDHLGPPGILDAGKVERVAGQVETRQVGVGKERQTTKARHRAVEAATRARRKEGAALLQPQVDIDPNRLPVRKGYLQRVEVVRTV